MAETELTLYTVKSRWAYIYDSPKQPYQRIVGMQIPDDPVRWVDQNASDDQKGRYQPQATERVVIPATVEMSRDLSSFFERFIMHESPLLRAGDDPDDFRYNCFRLGNWMLGITDTAEGFPFIAQAERIIAQEKLVDRPLAIGQIGVLGGFAEGEPTATHMMLGTGEDRTDCIHVMHTWGHLVLDTYEHVTNQFSNTNQNGQPIDRFGLYVP